MPVRLWDGTGPVLVDTSAWMQARRDPDAQGMLVRAIERDEVRWCWPVRYELMTDAREAAGIATVERTLDGLREVQVDRQIQLTVLATMRELAAEGSHGAHPYPLTDLTVAAAAFHAGIGILHFDQHLERLGDHLGADARWISAPG